MFVPSVKFPVAFSYGTSAEVVFGNGTSGLVGKYLLALAARKVLFIVDKGVSAAGLCERVEKSLGAAGVVWETYDAITTEPTDSSVQGAVNLIMSCNPDAVVGMGGGSAMDIAKAAAAIAANGGTVLEYLRKQRELKRPPVPVIAITTTSGTGAEVTPFSLVTDVERQLKMMIEGPLIMPKVALCDPELTLELPPLLTANTGLDALTHCIECYANRIFHPYAKFTALEGIRVIGRHLVSAVANGGDLATRWYMMWGANLGGLCIARGFTGDVHAFAGPISTKYGVPHGRSNAILLPHVMQFSLPGAVDAYADIAEALGENIEGLSRVAAAERAVFAVRRIVVDCGGPQRISQCGVRKEDIENIARDGFGRGNRLINPRIATREDVEAIYRAAF